MMTVDELIGSWMLVTWTSVKNGKPDGYPMGEEAKGQIIYSADGRMSGFLMRADFENAPHGAAATANTSLAYGGTYHLEGDRISHDVVVSTIAHWIGHPLIRTMAKQGKDLLLKTKPETTKSGNIYEHHLLWRRVSS